MSIAEQCAAAFEKMFPKRLGAVEKECAIDTVLAELARLTQQPEMVERIVRQASYVPSDTATDVVTSVLAALFREAGVSGGEG